MSKTYKEILEESSNEEKSFPKTTYQWKIVEAEGKVSQSGKLMFETSLEVCGPASIDIVNKETNEVETIDPRGTKARNWLVVAVPMGMKDFCRILQRNEFPDDVDIEEAISDEERVKSFAKNLVGMKFKAVGAQRITEQVDEVSGEAIRDEDGELVTSRQINVGQVL